MGVKVWSPILCYTVIVTEVTSGRRTDSRGRPPTNDKEHSAHYSMCRSHGTLPGFHSPGPLAAEFRSCAAVVARAGILT